MLYYFDKKKKTQKQSKVEKVYGDNFFLLVKIELFLLYVFFMRYVLCVCESQEYKKKLCTKIGY